jgi:hypothetical protein
MVSNLRRRRRRRKDAIKRKERSSDVRRESVTIRQCRIPTMNVTMTGAALLGHDVLQVPATITLALPSTPVATVIATTVVIHPTLRAGMIVVVIVQNPVLGDDKGITAWTLTAVVLLMNGGPDGRARTSLILTYANDGEEVVVTLLTWEYGMIVVVLRESATAVVRPPMTTSVHVLAHHPSHQQLQVLAKIAQRAWPP